MACDLEMGVGRKVNRGLPPRHGSGGRTVDSPSAYVVTRDWIIDRSTSVNSWRRPVSKAAIGADSLVNHLRRAPIRETVYEFTASAKRQGRRACSEGLQIPRYCDDGRRRLRAAGTRLIPRTWR